jgi:UDP-N-acetylglucosamine 2-epimerase
MKKIKVISVVGTRPEIIRLSRVFAALDCSPAIEHITVHTGQNYDFELNEIFYQDLGVRMPDFFLNAAASTPSSTIGQILINIEPILDKVRPDAFLVLGDTNSCLCAIPAKKRKIPVFHMEAGNRCFDQRVPEETNRKIVDHISDINLTYSDIAREYLLREGLSPERVIKTGSPMNEVLRYYMSNILNSNVLKALNLTKGKYFVVSSHREENINSDRNFFNLIDSLNQIAEKYKFPIIISTHPRTRIRLEELHKSQNKILLNQLIQWQKPLSFSDYNALQINSYAVLSDSGTISEESSILNFRALNIREAHERPEAMEEASVMMVGLNPDRIMQALLHLQNQNISTRKKYDLESEIVSENGVFLRNVNDYSMPNVSEKVVRIIISYTDYINSVVWKKS